MRARPTILMDVLDAGLAALGLRASEERSYEQFVVNLQNRGLYGAYVESSDRIEARQAGQPCPACNDQDVDCPVCGFTPEQLPPPGWYADPEIDGYRRYWTGQQWEGDPVIDDDDDVEVNGIYEPIGWES